jgi:hypothetical protein
MKSETMSIRRHATRILSLWCILLSAALGQDSGQGLHIRILCFGRIAGAEKLWLADAKLPGAGQEVGLHLNNFTGPYQTKTRDLVLTERPFEDGQAPPKAVVKVTVPNSLGGRILLILTPREADGASYLGIPIRDDQAGFAPGERRFVNLTNYPIGGDFDGKRTLIKPNTLTSLKLAAPPADRQNHEVVFHYQSEGKWMPLSSSVWPYDPEARSLVFCFWSPAEKRIRFQSIAELPASEEPEAN